MSNKRTITVHNYTGNPVFTDKRQPVESLTTEAYCMGGAEGTLAFFFFKEYLCIANGDDGHWVLIYYMHESWTEKFQKIVAEITRS